MADWSEFFRSTEFKQYRKEQARAVSRLLHSLVESAVRGGQSDLARVQGIMQTANLFLKLPETLTDDPELTNSLKHQFEVDAAGITRYLVEVAYRDEGE